jgi:hypothetical protein
VSLALSIVVRPEWLGAAVRLSTAEERFQLVAAGVGHRHPDRVLHYALTMDLLETELVDALADGRGGNGRRGLPLRDTYLPSIGSALAFHDRLCVGGLVALLAAARSGTRHGQREPDYVLLVQKRSARVLNDTGRLAVVPNAFHGPTTEAAEEAHLSASLERELESVILVLHLSSGSPAPCSAPG